ncbi:MAG: cobyric acid synthase [Plesiomonas sp.]
MNKTLHPAFTLMVQGTTSDAGKSAFVTGLCRVLQRRGFAVAPFKSQNMALNSAVSKEGGEIGRAQAVQAQACNIEPSIHMNPVLLKPNTDIGAQVIVQGKVFANMDAMVYHHHKPELLGKVLESFHILTNQYDAVIIEGAGSPAEINLRDRDIANMGFAEEADVPVIIIADIDKGGVFAHLYGTLALLSESEQQRVKGFIINRFRGDITLLHSGLDWLEQKTGKKVFGVLPYLHNLHLEAEDAINAQQNTNETTQLNIVIPVLTRTSNHNDFDALRAHPQVNVQFVAQGQPWPAADLVILPGTKSVRDDLTFLQQNGWDKALEKHLRYGGKVLGICGGYQMLGEWIHDPKGLEGHAGSSKGLGLLPVSTTLETEKQLKTVQGTLHLPQQNPCPITGYEIHLGKTEHPTNHSVIHNDNGQQDGCISQDQQIIGTYWHGLFDHPQACQHWLQWAGLHNAATIDIFALHEVAINRIADAIEEHIDLDALLIPARPH